MSTSSLQRTHKANERTLLSLNYKSVLTRVQTATIAFMNGIAAYILYSKTLLALLQTAAAACMQRHSLPFCFETMCPRVFMYMRPSKQGSKICLNLQLRKAASA